ncbi:hypothetical protein JCM3770_001198 [Rhodotorula araucariae]
MASIPASLLVSPLASSSPLPSPPAPAAAQTDPDGYPTLEWLDKWMPKRDNGPSLSPELRLQREVQATWLPDFDAGPSKDLRSPPLTRSGDPDTEDDEDDAEDDAASTSSWDSEREAVEAQLQWEESVRQLQALVNLVAVPWISRYFGRKWAYFMFERYLGIGLGWRFWIGPLASYVPKAWR